MVKANQKFILTDAYVSALEPIPGKKYEKRDAQWPGLLVRVEASGRKSYYYRYSINREVFWYKIGDAAMGAAAAKLKVRKLIGDVANGINPQAERKVNRQEGGITLEQLHKRYITEWAQKRNKSWRQAEYLIRAFVYPKWAKRSVSGISRADVKALLGSIAAPQTANQVKFAVSAVFKFGVGEEVVASNPTKNIADNPTKSRERILSATEIGQFWTACDQIHPVKAAALRAILLTGQRPGEVTHMRWMDLRDHWWELPGAPVVTNVTPWPGTKNGMSHRVWLPARVRELISGDPHGSGASFEATDTSVSIDTTGYVFASERGNAYGGLSAEMREISKMCKFDPPATAHDLRRTFGSTTTARGHGREAMDRTLEPPQEERHGRVRPLRVRGERQGDLGGCRLRDPSDCGRQGGGR